MIPPQRTRTSVAAVKNRLIRRPYSFGVIFSASDVEPRTSANTRLSSTSAPPSPFFRNQREHGQQTAGLRSQGRLPISFMKTPPTLLNGARQSLHRGGEGKNRKTVRAKRSSGSSPARNLAHSRSTRVVSAISRLPISGPV